MPVDYRTKRFSAWTRTDAGAAVAADIAATVGADGYATNVRWVLAGDYLGDTGEDWIGPGRSRGAWLAGKLDQVKLIFTPDGVAGEVIDHVRNGVRYAGITAVAEEPADPDDADAVAAQADEAALAADPMTDWARRVKISDHEWDAIGYSRLAGRGPLRVWVSPLALVEGVGQDGTPTLALPTDLAFAAALAFVRLAAWAPDRALRYEHAATGETAAVVLVAEILDDGTEREAAEVWYVDRATGLTHCRYVWGDAETDAKNYPPLNLGGQIPLGEIAGDVLLGEAERRQQRALNFAASGMQRALETSGYAALWLKNAAPNGTWRATQPEYETLEKPDGQGGSLYFWPQPRLMGPDVANELVGVVIDKTDAEGNVIGETVATPSVERFDPVDPQYVVTGASFLRALFLRNCKQGHLAGTSTAEASGDAYEQARAPFVKDLEDTRDSAVLGTTDVITAARALALAMTGPDDPMHDLARRYRLAATFHVDAGPVSADTQRLRNESVAAGTLSRATALAQNGSTDVTGEIRRIDAEPEQRAKRIGLALELMERGMSVPGSQAPALADWIGGELGVDAERLASVFVGEGGTVTQ